MDFTTQRVLSARIGIEVPNMGLQAWKASSDYLEDHPT